MLECDNRSDDLRIWTAAGRPTFKDHVRSDAVHWSGASAFALPTKWQSLSRKLRCSRTTLELFQCPTDGLVTSDLLNPRHTIR